MVVDAYQCDFRKERKFGEAARQLKADDGTFSTNIVTPRLAQGTMTAGQLGSRSHAFTGVKPGHSLTDLNDPRTKFMAKQLNRRLGFELFLDLFVRQSWNTAGELRFRYARLNAEYFSHNMSRVADRRRSIIETHIVESVKSPSFHVLTPNINCDEFPADN